MDEKYENMIVYKDRLIYVDRIVELPYEKIVYKEKIVEVPVEKIIYKEKFIEIPLETTEIKISDENYFRYKKIYQLFLKETECPICSNYMSEKKNIPIIYQSCCHTVCNECYDKNTLKCPVCEEIINSNILPKKNIFLMNLIKNYLYNLENFFNSYGDLKIKYEENFTKISNESNFESYNSEDEKNTISNGYNRNDVTYKIQHDKSIFNIKDKNDDISSDDSSDKYENEYEYIETSNICSLLDNTLFHGSENSNKLLINDHQNFDNIN